MVYRLKKYDKFEITGRGTVLAVHRSDNDIEEIPKVGDEVIADGALYKITDVEMFRNNFNIIGDNVGLLVKEI